MPKHYRTIKSTFNHTKNNPRWLNQLANVEDGAICACPEADPWLAVYVTSFTARRQIQKNAREVSFFILHVYLIVYNFFLNKNKKVGTVEVMKSSNRKKTMKNCFPKPNNQKKKFSHRSDKIVLSRQCVINLPTNFSKKLTLSIIAAYVKCLANKLKA